MESLDSKKTHEGRWPERFTSQELLHHDMVGVARVRGTIRWTVAKKTGPVAFARMWWGVGGQWQSKTDHRHDDPVALGKHSFLPIGRRRDWRSTGRGCECDMNCGPGDKRSDQYANNSVHE